MPCWAVRVTITLAHISYAIFNKCLAYSFSPLHQHKHASRLVRSLVYKTSRYTPPLLLHCQSAGPSELCLCAFSSSSLSGLVSGAIRDAIAPTIVPPLRSSKHKDNRLFITPPHATSAARNAHVPEAAIEAFQLVTRHRGKGERRGSNNSRGFATCPVQRRRS